MRGGDLRQVERSFQKRDGQEGRKLQIRRDNMCLVVGTGPLGSVYIHMQCVGLTTHRRDSVSLLSKPCNHTHSQLIAKKPDIQRTSNER